MTTAEELAKVDAAIDRILTGGQAHAEEGRSLQRANLSDLYARKNHLEAKLARETRGGAVVYVVPTP